MGNSNLKISGKCIQCGSCLGCGFSFLSSADDGSIEVSSGTTIEENGDEIKMLREICPVNAFEIIATEDKKSILQKLINDLKEYKGLEKPISETIKFDYKEYSISIPFASGANKYEYSSSSEAKKVALSEFERLMYSKIDTIILKIISEYRVKKVKPYFSSEEIDGSVYAMSNKKISELLQGIKNLLGDKLPDDFSEVNVLPDRDSTWKMLNKGELIAEELVSSVKRELDYPASHYDYFFDWEDMEVCEGTDWRGRIKYKNKYCYRGVQSAFKELADDLLDACGWAREDLEGAAINHAGWLVEVYNREVQEMIKEKLALVEKANK